MLAPAAMMQAGSRLIPHSRWKMQALGFFVSIEDDIPFAAALSQAEMVHYYPQYSTPYLVPQQVMRQIMKMPLALTVNLY